MCGQTCPGRASTAVLAALLFLGTASPSSAQTYAATVWTQLESQYSLAEADGYASRNYIIGRLNDGEEETWTINLFAGNSYRFTGACDGDCQDIDLMLLNSSGSELDSDLLVDDIPILNYTVKTSGSYSVRVIMAQCKEDPCYFGLGVFFK
jgi:hypothetical protein